MAFGLPRADLDSSLERAMKLLFTVVVLPHDRERALPTRLGFEDL
jgi:hypothetical protein